MAIEVLERAESTLDGALGTIENARLAVAECAEDAWSEFISNDTVSSCLETIQEAADDAWEACYPALEQAGDVAREGARNGIYLGGRVALGVADVGEDAYTGIRSNIELTAGDHEAAVETAQLQLIDSAADAWGDFMQVGDQIRKTGDYAQAGGEFATEIALGAVAMTAPTPVFAAAGVTLPAGRTAAAISGVYKATVDGQDAGYCVQVNPKGFGGEMTLIVGISTDGTVAGAKVTAHGETAGLGAKAQTDPEWITQFAGQPADGQLQVNKDGGTINAITGSTITSRAVTDGVNTAAAYVATLG